MSLRQLALGKNLEQRIENCEIQIDTHSSRLESEEGTRSRSLSTLNRRLDEQDKRLIRIERTIYAIGGALALLKFVMHS